MNTSIQRQLARKFVEQWTFRRGSEKGEDQQFWNALLGDVLGMEDVVSRVQYQVPVPMKGTTKFLDVWIPISLPTSTAGNGIIYAMESKT